MKLRDVISKRRVTIIYRDELICFRKVTDDKFVLRCGSTTYDIPGLTLEIFDENTKYVKKRMGLEATKHLTWSVNFKPDAKLYNDDDINILPSTKYEGIEDGLTITNPTTKETKTYWSNFPDYEWYTADDGDMVLGACLMGWCGPKVRVYYSIGLVNMADTDPEWVEWAYGKEARQQIKFRQQVLEGGKH